MPSLSPAGLTVSIKMRVDRAVVKDEGAERFILDTGGWLGRGVSLFVHQGQLTAVVGFKGRIWVVSQCF